MIPFALKNHRGFFKMFAVGEKKHTKRKDGFRHFACIQRSLVR